MFFKVPENKSVCIPRPEDINKHTQEDGFSFETYFPPQKIFVVITRVERLKKEN